MCFIMASRLWLVGLVVRYEFECTTAWIFTCGRWLGVIPLSITRAMLLQSESFHPLFEIES